MKASDALGRGFLRGCVLVWALFALLAAPAELPTRGPRPAVCREDMACWDWRTMGNRCGRDSLAEPVRCYR